MPAVVVHIDPRANPIRVHSGHPGIHTMLDLSIRHLPRPDAMREHGILGWNPRESWSAQAPCPNFGGLRWAPHQHGWVVFVMSGLPTPEIPEVVPEWLRPAHALAVEYGCGLINFDQDGETYPDLPTWGW